MCCERTSNAGLRVGVLGLSRGACSLVGEGGRHPHVDDDEVRLVLGDGVQQPVCVREGGHDLVAAVGEEPRKPFTEQRLVFGDHDAHGSSAVRFVPSPGRLSIRSVPP